MMDSEPFKKLKETHKEQFSIIEKYRNKFPVKVSALSKELGINPKIFNLGLGYSGQIKKRDGEYIGFVNRFEKKDRQRYTIASLIGHYLINRERLDLQAEGIQLNVLYYSGQYKQEVDKNACAIGADILCPLDALQNEIIKRYGEGVIYEEEENELAEYFEVAAPFISVRVSQLPKQRVALKRGATK